MAHDHDREGLYRFLGPAIDNALKEWNEKKGEEECAMCIGAALAAHAAKCLYAYANAFEDYRKHPTACVMQGMGAGMDLFRDVFAEDFPESMTSAGVPYSLSCLWGGIVGILIGTGKVVLWII